VGAQIKILWKEDFWFKGDLQGLCDLGDLVN